MLGSFGVVVREQLFQFVDALGVIGNVLAVLQSFLEDHVHQRVDKHRVGTRRDRQVNVGELGEHGDTRIHHDQRKLALLQLLLQAPVNNGVLLG